MTPETAERELDETIKYRGCVKESEFTLNSDTFHISFSLLRNASSLAPVG